MASRLTMTSEELSEELAHRKARNERCKYCTNKAQVARWRAVEGKPDLYLKRTRRFPCNSAACIKQADDESEREFNALRDELRIRREQREAAKAARAARAAAREAKPATAPSPASAGGDGLSDLQREIAAALG